MRSSTLRHLLPVITAAFLPCCTISTTAPPLPALLDPIITATDTATVITTSASGVRGLNTAPGSSGSVSTSATCTCLVQAKNGTCPAKSAEWCTENAGGASGDCKLYYQDKEGTRRAPTEEPGLCCQWSSTDDQDVKCSAANNFKCPALKGDVLGSNDPRICSKKTVGDTDLHLCACGTVSEVKQAEQGYTVYIIIGAMFVAFWLCYAFWFYCWSKSGNGDCINSQKHCCVEGATFCVCPRRSLGCFMAISARVFCCPCRVFCGCCKSEATGTDKQ